MHSRTVFALLASATRFTASWAGTASISSYPLAVRNPYLSAWLPGDVASDAPTAEPQFWDGQTLYWPIFARVDGVTYYLFSEVDGVDNAQAATQTAIEFSSTHTVVTLAAGDDVTVTVDFFSPVSPADYLRQSLPYSYVTVSVSGAAQAHDVQLLSGVDDSWAGFAAAGQDLDAGVQTAADGASVYFNLSDPAQTLYAESDQMAAWGSLVFGSRPAASSSLTWQYGARRAVQQAFVAKGTLGGEEGEAAYGAGYLFAMAHDFGSVESAAATFAVGWDRAHALTFLGQSYSGYHLSEYSAPATALPAFLADYDDAYAESLAFDARVVAAGSAFSTEYTDLLEQSVRQIYGAMDVVVPTSSLDTADMLIFLKEISSNGDVSTIDVIFPTFPALYVISPEWIKFLCLPYLIYLNTDEWPEEYIPHDLGTSGHNDGVDEAIYVEATAPFFTLLYAYTEATGASTAWLDEYTAKLLTAGDWTVANGLYPSSQLSTVDAIPASANQTGLATSAAVGLKALGALLGLANYTAQGDAFAAAIYGTSGSGSATGGGAGVGVGLDDADDAADATHLTYNYGAPDSWVTAFHLFPDALLGLGAFPASASELEAAWYAARYADLAGGVLYAAPGDGDDDVDFMISEWALWAGAASDRYAAGHGIGAKAVAAMHALVTNGLNPVPMPTKFVVEGASGIGTYVNNKARPTVGSVWALLALNGDW